MDSLRSHTNNIHRKLLFCKTTWFYKKNSSLIACIVWRRCTNLIWPESGLANTSFSNGNISNIILLRIISAIFQIDFALTYKRRDSIFHIRFFTVAIFSSIEISDPWNTRNDVNINNELNSGYVPVHSYTTTSSGYKIWVGFISMIGLYSYTNAV